jgi:hypothetical protein
LNEGERAAIAKMDLKDDIYMPPPPPPGYLKPRDEGKVLKLLRSLYSLKQARFEWSKELEKFFLDAEFTRSQVDQAVYFRRTTDEHMVIMVSVDDMAVTSRHLRHIERFKSQLRERFEITDLGELSWLLGLKVERDRRVRTITLSQGAYVETVLQRFHMQEAKPEYVPMKPSTILSTDQSPSTHAELEEMKDVPYQRAIGSLMYAAVSTRPDIAFSVAILSQFMRNPGRAHWEAVKQILRNLQATKDMRLTLGSKNTGIEAYVDADWASQPHRHLMSGYVVLLNGGPVAWSARKQSLIALSMAEAEYIALTSVAREVLFLQALVDELYGTTQDSIPIYCDNQGAISLASNNKFHGRTKHIDLRYHYIRELVKNGTLHLEYCPTEENLADAFTKALPRPRLDKLRAKMFLACVRGGVLSVGDVAQ